MRSSDIVCGLLFSVVLPKLFFSAHSVAHLRQLNVLRLTVALFLPLLVIWRAYYRRRLDFVGCLTAFIIGCLITLVNGIFSALLIGFFYIGTKATHVGEWRKHSLKLELSPRTWTQVLSNGGLVAAYAALQLAFERPGEHPVVFSSTVSQMGHSAFISSCLHLAVLATLSCAAGDTLASELAPLYSSADPVLIIQPWRKVPVGTNGGVTLCGVILSLFGGLFIGFLDLIFTVTFTYFIYPVHHASFLAAFFSQTPLLIIGASTGVVGSLMDSLLGASLQFSGQDKTSKAITEVPGPAVLRIAGKPLLDNNLVNLFAGLFTSLLTVYMFYLFVK